MKPDRRKVTIFFYVLLAGFVAWKQLPVLLNNAKKEGRKLGAREFPVINARSPGESITIPGKGNSIIIFWATWCGPCKVEMNRLKASVESGSIPDRAIIAISASESPGVIRKFLADTPYPFTFIEAPELAQELDVRATPTTVFLEGETVVSMSTGMSLIGIWRAERFL